MSVLGLVVSLSFFAAIAARVVWTFWMQEQLYRRSSDDAGFWLLQRYGDVMLRVILSVWIWRIDAVCRLVDRLTAPAADEQLAIARSAVGKYICLWLECEHIDNLDYPNGLTPEELAFLIECRNAEMARAGWDGPTLARPCR